MSEDNGNGNGQLHVVDIDVTNDMAFRTGVVQNFQLLMDRTHCLVDMKKKVDRHDNIVRVGKWASIPIIAFVQQVAKHALAKVGW